MSALFIYLNDKEKKKNKKRIGKKIMGKTEIDEKDFVQSARVYV